MSHSFQRNGSLLLFLRRHPSNAYICKHHIGFSVYQRHCNVIDSDMRQETSPLETKALVGLCQPESVVCQKVVATRRTPVVGDEWNPSAALQALECSISIST